MEYVRLVRASRWVWGRTAADGKICDPRLNSHLIMGRERFAG